MDTVADKKIKPDPSIRTNRETKDLNFFLLFSPDMYFGLYKTITPVSIPLMGFFIYKSVGRGSALPVSFKNTKIALKEIEN